MLDPNYIYAFFILIILFFISTIISKLFTNNNILKNENFFLRTCVESYFGVLFLISLFATIRCNGISLVGPICALTFFLYWKLHSRIRFKKIDSVSLKNILVVLSIILFCLVTIIICFVPYESKYLITNNADVGFYSYLSKNIYKYKLETVYFGNTLKDESGRVLYHYLDLWFNVFVSKLFIFNSYYSYFLVVKGYLSVQFVLLCVGLLKKYNVEPFAYLFGIGVLFFGTSIFFIDTEGIKWVDQLEYYPSIINYHGGLFACLHIAISFFLIFLFKKNLLGYYLLSISGLVNPLLMPSVILFFSVKVFFQSIYYLRKEKKIGHLLISPYLLSLVISLLIYVYSTKITGTHGGIISSDIIKTLKIFLIHLLLNYFEFFIVNIFLFFGLIYLYFKIKKIYFFIDLLLFISISYFVHSVLFETIRFDLWQLKIITCAGTLTLFGYFGLILFLNSLNKVISKIILSCMFIAVFYFSMFSDSYAFGPGTIYKKNAVIKIDKRSLPQLKKNFEKLGNGFAITKSDEYFPVLAIPAGINFTEILNLNNVSYRINLSKPDTINEIKKNVLKRYIQNDISVYLPKDSLNLFRIIDSKKFMWMYTDIYNYYIPEYLIAKFPKKYSFGDVIIYTK